MKSLKQFISIALAGAIIATSAPVFSMPVYASESGSDPTVTGSTETEQPKTVTTTVYNEPNITNTNTYSETSSTAGAFGADLTSPIYHSVDYNKVAQQLSTIQENKIATSDIRGRTEGFRITNPKDPSKSVTISMKDAGISQTSEEKNGMVRIVTNYAASLVQKMVETAGISFKGGTVMRIDHIMSVSTDGGKTYSGKLDDNGNFQTNRLFFDNSPYASLVANMSSGDGLYDWNEMQAFIDTFGWANKTSWTTNWEKILYIDKDGNVQFMTLDELINLPDIDPEDPPPTPTPNRDTSDGYFVHRSQHSGSAVTYNDSRKYTDGEGEHQGFADRNDADGNGSGIIIPSGEKYLNGVTVDTYQGAMSLGFRTVAHQLSFSRFYYTVNRYQYNKEWRDNIIGYTRHENYDDAMNPGRVTSVTEDPIYGDPAHYQVWVPYWYGSKDWKDVSGSAWRRAHYMYIYDLDMYDFGTVTTSNETFTLGSETYTGNDAHVRGDIAKETGGDADNNGGGDPIGPVTGGASTISNRPTYSCDINTGGWQHYEGNTNTRTGSNFVPSDSHIDWTGFKNAPYGLGTFNVYAYNPDIPPEDSSEAHAMADATVDGWLGDGVQGHYSDKEWVNMTYYAQSTCDGLILGYDSNVVMDHSTVDVCLSGESAGLGMNYDYGPAPRHSGKYPSYVNVGGVIGNMEAYITGASEKETYESTPAFGKDQQLIAKNKKNNRYSTSVSAPNYNGILPSSGSFGAGGSAGGIKSGWEENEPIIVQTPVVAPITMYDDSSTGARPTSGTPIPESDNIHETQLAGNDASSGRDANSIQLRLDNTYWIKFDPHEHLRTQGYKDYTTGEPFDNTWSGDKIKFDKYVKAKYVHFPFAACVYMGSDTTPTYYPLVTNESQEGYWIKVYDQNYGTHDNLEWIRFYIPAWAQEGDFTGADGIRVKVEAQNVTTGDEESHDTMNDDGTDLKNPDKQYYIATYDINAQVSGWIYDFQIVGINNRDLHDKELTEAVESQWHDLLYPFAYNYEEKKAGTKNRLGGDSRYADIAQYVRYTRSREIAHNGDSVANSILTRNTGGAAQWSKKNTIIIDNSKSNKYADAGSPPTGTEFAFSVKTMSNLWNDGDYVTIEPSFWWMSDDNTTKIKMDPNSGNIASETSSTSSTPMLHVYYHDFSQNGDQLYIEYGSTEDRSLVKSVSLSNTMFNGSYWDEDVLDTIKHPVYDESTASFSDTVTSDLQTYVNHFLNQQTNSYTLSSINLNSNLRLLTGNLGELKANMDHDIGSYSDLTTMYKFNGNAANLNSAQTSLKPSMQTWYGTYLVPSNLFVTTMSRQEVNDYALTHGGIADDDHNVWLDGGYLIVHFDITSHNSLDSRKNLSYSGWYGDGAGPGTDSQNMWKDQSYGPEQLHATVGSTVGTTDGHYGNRDITVEYGDVIIINTGESIDDWFSANIFSAH